MLAPLGRDAAVATAILAEAGIRSHPVGSIDDLVAAFEGGVGFVLVTEECLATSDNTPLANWLTAQPEWSDLPFILLTTRGGGLERNPSAARYLRLLGNVTFLERPFHPTTLVSVAQSALRGRRRQYDARTRLHELHEGAERYRSLFESIEVGFCIIELIFDSDGRAVDYVFVEANPAFVRQSGHPDPVGKRMRELNALLEDHWFENFGHVARTGEAIRFENEAALRKRWYDVYAFPVSAPGADRVAILFNDITQRRAVEEELRELTTSLEQRVEKATAEREAALVQLHEAHKLEMLGQLTGGVAHDFNNLLTPIAGTLDLLNRRLGANDARSARLIANALESAERAKTLVQRLLGFARRQVLQTRPVDVGALLEGLRDLIASSVGSTIALNIAPAPNLPAGLVDPNQLELALLNLCVNARDAMPKGGTLTITADAVELHDGEVPGVGPGAYLRLAVQDTGTGMDAETLARAIEPFYSTKEIGKGTGLGLSMVHGLASQLGGGFRLSSEPGHGTTAELWLPVTSAKAAKAKPVAAPADDGGNGRKLAILLADDEQIVRTAVADILRDCGHDVREAASGQEALDCLAEARFDVLVTDYKMPGIDGARLAQRVRKEHPGMPVLLITGYSGSTQDQADLPRLAKPFRRPELIRAIEGLFADAG
ncbi:MAG: response regulator [Novosphingobium sp.]|nr:response regulator [Novosphingobium sp.]